MNVPFTTEAFLNIFRSYNEAVFPAQIVFNLIALLTVYLVFTNLKYKDKIINSVLSFFFLWIGIVYQIMFFSGINRAAYLFGALFIIQGILFYIYGVYSNKLNFRYNMDYMNFSGLFFILYALIIYPTLGYSLGHGYPNSPTFGLPCPTTIFTFGILLFINNKIPAIVLIIPVIWSIIGFGAALNFSIYEDAALLIAGLTSLALLINHNRRIKLLPVTI